MMSWPAPYNPKVMHLWLDLMPALLGSTLDQTNLLNLMENSCFNTFTMYNITTITVGTTNRTDLANFICNAKTNYGICKVAGIVNPYDLPDGTRYIRNIIDYNNSSIVSNDPCRRIDYVTLENEFWNLETGLNPVIYTSTTCCITTTQGSSSAIITVVGTNTPCSLPSNVTVGMMIWINGSYRQITSISNFGTGTRNQIIFDRNFDTSYICEPFYIRNNQNFYAVDFETFLVRVRDYIRPLAIANNLLPVEMYVSRRLTNDQYERLIPHIDRFIIEAEYDAPTGTSATYPLYNDPNYNTIKNVLDACSVIRTGTISINANTNIINGVGTTFTRDLGRESKIIVNGSQIYTISTIVNDTQAIIVGTSAISVVGGTYATYFDYMPLWFISTGTYAYPNRRNWMTNSNLKSYADVYRFHTQSSFSVGTDIQIGNTPISFNDDPSTLVRNSVNAVGLSVYNRIGFSSLSPVRAADYPCPPCSGETIGCEFTATTTSNCLIAVFTNPICEDLCSGTISASTSYGTPPFTYSLTGLTNSTTYSNTNGYFTGLCQDTYVLCVTDFLGTTECYYQPIDLVYTFFVSIDTFLNGFCITITGGSGTYHVYQDNSVLVWDYNNTTNCYTADCNTLSVITVTDTNT